MRLTKVIILLIILIVLAAIILHFKLVMLKSFTSYDTVLGEKYKFTIKDLLSIILISLPGFSRLLIFN